MLASRRLIISERGVARVMWSILEFYIPLNFSGMAEDRIVKFCARVGPISISLVMTNCPPRGVVKVTWRLNFWQMSVSRKRYKTEICLPLKTNRNRMWPVKWQSNNSDLEWPWRSFTGCRPFLMQSVEHLCSILHDFKWLCARDPCALAELLVWIRRLQTR